MTILALQIEHDHRHFPPAIEPAASGGVELPPACGTAFVTAVTISAEAR
jgi:hypothetical protein